VLVPAVLWGAPDLDVAGLRLGSQGVELPRGVGLPGSAWERRHPTHAVMPTAPRRWGVPAAPTGLPTGFAIPAVADGEVLAVIELQAKEPMELTDNLRRAMAGVGFEVGAFLARRRGRLRPPLVTAREIEVLSLASVGASVSEIATRLVVSPATVKTHFANIYAKLGVPDRATAVAYALRQGLID
jgi:DNA-binding CsgD family transcriptional regulator